MPLKVPLKYRSALINSNVVVNSSYLDGFQLSTELSARLSGSPKALLSNLIVRNLAILCTLIILISLPRD